MPMNQWILFNESKNIKRGGSIELSDPMVKKRRRMGRFRVTTGLPNEFISYWFKLNKTLPSFIP